MELLQPHAPGFCQGLRLPELKRGKSDRNDLRDSSFVFKLCKEAHLRHILGRNLLKHCLCSLSAAAVGVFQSLNRCCFMENFLPIIFQI
jgi:hypothetical protein